MNLLTRIRFAWAAFKMTGRGAYQIIYLTDGAVIVPRGDRQVRLTISGQGGGGGCA